MLPSVESTSVYSVCAFLTRVRFGLKREFRNIRVRGEVFACNGSAAGHLYITLKEGNESLQVAYFRNHHHGLAKISRGDLVECQGYVDIYNSTFQMVASRVEVQGDGRLFEAFAKLKAELEKKGYFDKIHKKAIPAFPQRIALITSESGAALQDILSTASDVLYCLDITIHHVSVQGQVAVGQICEAIAAAQSADYDLLVLCRGGGSALDLQPFNSQEIAEAIFRSRLPVISAVGHETDLSICDLVADLRVETPTAFGHLLATPFRQIQERLRRAQQRMTWLQQNQLTRNTAILERHERDITLALRRTLDRSTFGLESLSAKLDKILERRVTHLQQKTEYLGNHLHRLSPQSRVEHLEHQCSLLRHRLENRMQASLDISQHRLGRCCDLLETLSPRKVLQRGYSVLLQADGTVAHNARDLHPGEPLTGILHRGTLKLTITHILEDTDGSNSHDQNRPGKSQKRAGAPQKK
ncbi:exodeoxyribonuclease VII, large subunit [Desulfurispirillum indicum S5]|uniref:Exodeoxyribonuclease 7 large subunit n=1 Tax=Desulfurispirillum indicum (strain ATCC BAA-1389 / DSM 22839 / S5) TaxID=653733 RepID=E6W256_DESIS|nr:exodeoxyribonuclease VII large subunit [Desulfurispirillum indicum]ADU65514.1 exodeoxyribonuclease VII, large subunit [Desulfurispirillum indicum S5]